MKYLPQHDCVYPKIAKRVGKCCFVFVRFENKAELFERLLRRLKRAFAAEGLDADEYCKVVNFQPRGGFFALLRSVDVYLDCISFSGFTTAFQAVQCGLPIVALEGGLLKNRLAAAILRRIGVSETIGRSVEQYVDIAVNLAKDAAWRSRLRDRINAHGALAFEDPAPIRALEDFLERAVREARRNRTLLSGVEEPADLPANASLAALQIATLGDLGGKRLENIHLCLEAIRREGIAGDLRDTGPDQGGAARYMRGYLAAYQIFDRNLWTGDMLQPIDPDGFLALLRVDGGGYEHTMRVLEALYELVVPGGFVVVNDCADAGPCRKAIEHFRQRRGMRENIISIDQSAIFWRKD